jgi:cell surface protein SprA
VVNEENGLYIPTYIIQQVAITERFNPLIGVNVRTKSRFNARAEYRLERALALQLSNTQITEMRSKDFAVELGFTKANVKLPFRLQGRTVVLENDLTFRVNVAIKDTETIQRKIDDESIITNGNLNFQLRPTISYILNDQLQLQFYFTRTVNDPKISNSFKRTTTESGLQIRFNLAQ